uniref:Uncharacterized protein n=1 Tax=Rhizophora mucronata TaxID=61149 RepID=A0A2P2PJX0_RHIMU
MKGPITLFRLGRKTTKTENNSRLAVIEWLKGKTDMNIPVSKFSAWSLEFPMI